MSRLTNKEIERLIAFSVIGPCAVEVSYARHGGRNFVVALPDHDAVYMLTMPDGKEEQVLAEFAREVAKLEEPVDG